MLQVNALIGRRALPWLEPSAQAIWKMPRALREPFQRTDNRSWQQKSRLSICQGGIVVCRNRTGSVSAAGVIPFLNQK